MALEIADYAVIALMLVLSAAVGLYFRFTGGRQRTTDEFLMAGKNMTILPVAFSLMATFLSAVSILGVPADVYMYGTQYMLFIVGLPIGAIIASHVYLPVFFEMQTKTAYEYLEKRFGKTTRIIASFLFSLQMILYMAVVLYTPSLAFNAVTGLSTWGSILMLAGVCTFYCSLGGLKAVLWSDVLQASLMYITLVSVIVKGTMDIGGFWKSFEIASNGSRLQFFNFNPSLEDRYTVWNCVFAGISTSLTTFATNQAQIQRLLSIRSLKRAQLALYISTPLIMAFIFLCVWDGIVVYSLFHDCDPLLKKGSILSSLDQLIPYAVLMLFAHLPGAAGLCIAGVFSASLSSVSSAVNSLTAVTMEDFIRPYSFGKKLTEAWAAFLAKLIAIAYGGICLLLILLVENFRGVLEAAYVLFGIIAGPTQGIFTLGMLTTTANEPGILIGLFFAFGFNIWMGLGSYNAKLEIPYLPRSTEGCTGPANNVTLLDTMLQDGLISNDANESQNVFPLYKVSFLWYEIVGTLTSTFVGYICSYIIGRIRGRKIVKPELISPVLRKWFFNSDEEDLKTVSKIKLSEINGENNMKHVLGSMDNGEEKQFNTIILQPDVSNSKM